MGVRKKIREGSGEWSEVEWGLGRGEESREGEGGLEEELAGEAVK